MVIGWLGGQGAEDIVVVVGVVLFFGREKVLSERRGGGFIAEVWKMVGVNLNQVIGVPEGGGNKATLGLVGSWEK